MSKKSKLMLMIFFINCYSVVNAQTFFAPGKKLSDLPKDLFSVEFKVDVFVFSESHIIDTVMQKKMDNNLRKELLTMGIKIISDKERDLAKKSIMMSYINRLEGNDTKEGFLLEVRNFSALKAQETDTYFRIQARTLDKLSMKLKEKIKTYPVSYFDQTPNLPDAEKLAALNVNLLTDTSKKERRPSITLITQNVKVEYKNNTTSSSTNYYFKPEGEKEVPIGIFANKLRTYISSNPEAVKYIDQYCNVKYTAIGLTLVSIGSAGAYAYTVFSKEESSREYFNSGQLVILGIGAAAWIAQMIITSNDEKYLKNAVEEYNKSVSKNSSGLIPAYFDLGIIPAKNNFLCGRVGWRF